MKTASAKWFRGMLLGIAYILGIIGIVASGGGGGGSSESSESSEVGGPAPSAAADPALGFDIKTFRFTWTDVADATYYRLLENPDGFSGFSKVGDDVPQGTETIDHYVALYNRINASYILQSCNDNGCTDSNTLFITGTLVDAIGYFKASNTDADDFFGASVSLSDDGNTLAVGAYYEDSNATGIDGDQTDNSATISGAVYVFTRSNTVWSQQAYIKASNTDAGDLFGGSVSLSADGDTLVVGAPGEDSGATGIDGNQTNNLAPDSGAVYVFTRSGIDWSQQAYIKAINRDEQDGFGLPVSLSDDGNTLVVGAYEEDSNATGINGNRNNDLSFNSGAVYVYTRSGTTWTRQAYIKASNTDNSDLFGYSVSLSDNGNTLAVGAQMEDSSATGIDGDQTDNFQFESGAVYVFTRNGVTWSQQAYIKASKSAGGDRFGRSVSLSDDGNTLAVGAYYEDSNATGIDGDQTNGSAARSGAVYVFTRSGIDWSQQAYIKASNTDAGDFFGGSVSLSADGDTLAVGGHGEDSNATGINGDQTDNSLASAAGAVYVFARSGITWSQQAYVKPSNTDIFDYIGISVSLSADGDTLAVGAHYEGSNATGIGGDQADNSAGTSGAAYLF